MDILQLSFYAAIACAGAIIGAYLQAKYFTKDVKPDYTGYLKVPSYLTKEQIERGMDYLLLSREHFFRIRQGNGGKYRWFMIDKKEDGDEHTLCFSQHGFKTAVEAINDARACGYVDAVHMLSQLKED